MAKEVGGNCGVALDIFHMNIEEADWQKAISGTGDYLADFHVAENNRMPQGKVPSTGRRSSRRSPASATTAT